MEFKKCVRCGCFFTSEDYTCCNCAEKDKADMVKLHSYFESNNQSVSAVSIHTISLDTGINALNINRFLQNRDFANLFDITNTNEDTGNISII